MALLKIFLMSVSIAGWAVCLATLACWLFELPVPLQDATDELLPVVLVGVLLPAAALCIPIWRSRTNWRDYWSTCLPLWTRCLVYATVAVAAACMAWFIVATFCLSEAALEALVARSRLPETVLEANDLARMGMLSLFFAGATLYLVVSLAHAARTRFDAVVMAGRLPVILLASFLAVWLKLLAFQRIGVQEPNYSRIEPGLHMGGHVPEPPRGTRSVLNLCEDADAYEAEVHRHEPIRDATPAPDLDWLRRMVEFVDEQRRAGRPVYVHCHQGISRSGMVVVAYLMAKHGWTRYEALAYVRTRRPGVRPNPAFMERLQEWEAALKK